MVKILPDATLRTIEGEPPLRAGLAEEILRVLMELSGRQEPGGGDLGHKNDFRELWCQSGT